MALIEFEIPKSSKVRTYLYNMRNRLLGNISKIDQLQIACYCEPPMFFLLHGVLVPHAYGITLSVDEIGAECLIRQNVTIGTNAREMGIGEHTTGHKPLLGHRVCCYASSVVSGHIHIGNNVIIAANAFVDKDIPDNSIVYGRNNIKPLEKHHKRYLSLSLWDCVNTYKLISGLVYKNERLYIDEEYAKRR